MRIVSFEATDRVLEVGRTLGLTIDSISSLAEIGDEPTWLLPHGYEPAVGAYEAITGWLAERDGVLYGDTSFRGEGRLHRRPRFRPITMRSTWDLGSIALPHGTTARTWEELREEIFPDLAHVPVTFDVTNTPSEAPVSEGWRKLGRYNAPVPISKPVTFVIPSIGSPIEIDGTTRPALLVCLESLPDADVIVVAGPAMDPTVLDQAREIIGDRLTVVEIDGPFNFSASCNLGAAHATGLVCFLNDDVEASDDDWLPTMIAVHELTGGPVGCRLTFPDRRIQHAGITINPETLEPNHLYYKLDPGAVTDPVAHACSEFLAVTGACLLIDRDTFANVGGFSEKLPVNYNDVDLCLKLAHAGYPAVCVNTHTLVHRESTSRTVTITDDEQEWMTQWRAIAATDPFTYAWS